MKLLNCLKCHDIRLIQSPATHCKCGYSVAEYRRDGVTVIYDGPCRILAISNESYKESINDPKMTPLQLYQIKEGLNIHKRIG